MLKYLSSIKLTIIILIFLFFLCLAGVTITQVNELHNSPAVTHYYYEKYGKIIGALIVKFQLNDIFNSAIFYFFMLAFSVNLCACSFRKRKLNLKAIGFYMTHISVLFIIFGALIGNIYGDKGFVWLEENKSFDSYISSIDGKHKKLNFSVLLKKFEIVQNTNDYGKIIFLLKNYDDPFIFKVEISEQWRVATPTDYKFRILKYYSNLKFDNENKPFNLNEKPENPAVLIELKKNDKTEKRYVFSKFPHFHRNGVFDDVQLLYKQNLFISDYISDIEINKNREILKYRLKVNSPFSIENYKIYQSSYDPENLKISGLEIVNDPGYYIVYIGFVMLTVGIFFVFYSKLLKEKLSDDDE